MDTVDTLSRELKTAWTRATSSDPEKWTVNNPSWGQCAVTACIVQDRLGGDIVWASARLPDGTAISHYFNHIGDQEVDLTRDRFPPGTHIPKGEPKTKGFPTTRDYILSFPVTAQRYDALKSNLT